MRPSILSADSQNAVRIGRDFWIWTLLPTFKGLSLKTAAAVYAGRGSSAVKKNHGTGGVAEAEAHGPTSVQRLQKNAITSVRTAASTLPLPPARVRVTRPPLGTSLPLGGPLTRAALTNQETRAVPRCISGRPAATTACRPAAAISCSKSGPYAQSRVLGGLIAAVEFVYDAPWPARPARPAVPPCTSLPSSATT